MIFKPGRDEAQVAAGGLVQGEQLDAQFVDFDIQPVYFMVALDDDVGQIGIAVDQRFDRFLDLVFDQSAHVKNLFTELWSALLRISCRYVLSSCATSILTEPAGNVIFSLALFRRSKQFPGLAEFDQLADVEKSGVIR